MVRSRWRIAGVAAALTACAVAVAACGASATGGAAVAGAVGSRWSAEGGSVASAPGTAPPSLSIESSGTAAASAPGAVLPSSSTVPLPAPGTAGPPASTALPPASGTVSGAASPLLSSVTATAGPPGDPAESPSGSPDRSGSGDAATATTAPPPGNSPSTPATTAPSGSVTGTADPAGIPSRSPDGTTPPAALSSGVAALPPADPASATSIADNPGPSAAGTPTSSASPDATGSSPAIRTPQQVLGAMTLAQQVGELLMVGDPAGSASSTVTSQITSYHVGSVILTGRSSAGVTHTHQVVAALQARTGAGPTAGTRLVVATDQEGGEVQVLSGPGFSRIPSALYQGTHWSLQTIRANAAVYGRQLKAAGITLDLAPVMDTVSQSFAPYNAPIGAYDREFGYTPHDVLMRGNAFANGLRDARMGVTVKHFPGLGRVTGNTDTTAGVTDYVTTRYSTSIQPFAEGVRSGADAVMVSTAIYSKIAPGVPAAFSPTIMRTMLRGDLGFTGVIVSDDLGNARQVQAWSAGARAVRFVAAGGDLVLTVNPATVPAMYHALLSRAESDAGFRATVRAAALHVLQLKANLGLLG